MIMKPHRKEMRFAKETDGGEGGEGVEVWMNFPSERGI